MNLQDKVAMVTGGASGLGEATVRCYVANGCKVAILDMSDERGQALQAELGNSTIYIHCDVVDESAVKQAISATVEAFGVVHICNNYAGIGPAAKTVSKGEAMPLTHFTNIINVNLVGTFNVLRLAAEQMAKQDAVDEDGQRGVIINTASVAAYEGQIGQAAYSASKGGVVGMTLPIARDLAALGIRVNTIVPGLIHTPLFEQFKQTNQAAYESLAASPLYPKRMGKGEEIAHLSKYIVENDYTNGECIRMDGGIRMQPK